MKKRKCTTCPSFPRSYVHRIEHTEGRMRKLLTQREGLLSLLKDLDTQILVEDPLFHVLWNLQEELEAG